jgi:fimbrial chaperone protein
MRRNRSIIWGIRLLRLVNSCVFAPAFLVAALPAAVLVVFFGVCLNVARASNFEIAPVVLELSDASPAGTIRFANQDDHPISLQVRGNAWNQSGGADVLTPADGDLLVSPPIFTLAPGATQIIRVILRRKAVAVETAYRLLIDEIPAPLKEPAINFRFRISMPVFVEPADAPVLKMAWRAGLPATSGMPATPEITLDNLGNRRIKLSDIAIVLPDGRKLAPLSPPNPYTLTGASRSYRFARDAAFKPGATIRISAGSDTGRIETGVVVLP